MPNSTQAHARALRVALESLDDVQRSRREQVARATRLADAEDITPRILKAASGFEQWVEVQPAMLEDVLEEELAKYEKFAAAITEGEAKQESLLATITVSAKCGVGIHVSLTISFHGQERNELFLRSRKGDPIVKEREHALQSLDLAYHKYKEITRNLDEGLKVCDRSRVNRLPLLMLPQCLINSSTTTSQAFSPSSERAAKSG